MTHYQRLCRELASRQGDRAAHLAAYLLGLVASELEVCRDLFGVLPNARAEHAAPDRYIPRYPQPGR